MATILYLTHVEFGKGSLTMLPELLAGIGVTRPFVVSDHGIAASGLLELVTARLPAGSPTFLDVPPNPTEAAVLAAVEAYKASGANGIVALGGTWSTSEAISDRHAFAWLPGAQIDRFAIPALVATDAGGATTLQTSLFQFEIAGKQDVQAV